MNTILRQSLIIGLCLVPFIPLIVANPLFFPFITGKNFAFRILVEICFALWAILALRDPKFRPRWSSLPIIMLAFLFSAGISALLAENPSKAFWSNFERMEGWIGLLHSTAYFFVLWLTMNSEKLWSRFWNVSIGVSAIVGVYGLFQLGGLLTINQGGVRVDGTLGNATYLAVYMLFHVFITLFYLVKSWSTSKWLRYWYIPVLLLQIFLVFSSATRGTILGLVGGLFLTGVILLFLQRNNPALKKWGVGVLIALVVLVGGFFAIKDTSFVRDNEVLTRLASISLSEGKTRFTIWGMAWEGFQDRPIFGWGQEGFNYIFNKYYEPSLHAQEPWFDRAHNAFIDWLIAGGIVGFLLYVSFYLLPLWLIWKDTWKKEGAPVFSITEKALLTGLLAAYGFHNLFVFDNLVSYLFFMSILAYIAFRTLPSDGEGTPLPAPMTTIAAPAIAVLMAAVFYFANVPALGAASNIIQGITPHETIQENFDYFKRAVENKGIGRQEVREQLVQFAAQVRSLNAGDAAFQSEVAQFAIEQMEEEIAQAPNDARLRVFLGSFHRQSGDYARAEMHLVRAHELSPQKQSILFELGVLETARGNAQPALDYFKEAYELAPEYDNARAYYAATLIRTNQVEAASELLLERWGTVTPSNDAILQAYFDIQDFKSVLAIIQSRIDADPGNAQLHIQLAAIHLEAGNRAETITALERAIELDPSFKEQGEYYIEEIRAGRNP